MSLSLFDLSGRVAVVLGGTSRVGRSIATGLAQAGAQLVISSRSLENCSALLAELQTSGHRGLAVASDVRERTSLVDLRERVLAEYGRVDILVNAAGYSKRTKALELTLPEWSAVIDTGLTGTFYSCQVFGESLTAQGHGSIVNLVSLASLVGFPEVAAYAASKAGVIGLTRALAVEWAPRGVRVNAIVPGLLLPQTTGSLLPLSVRGDELQQRTPMRRFGKIEELRGAAIFLASDASRFVTGQLLVVDGGFLACGAGH